MTGALAPEPAEALPLDPADAPLAAVEGGVVASATAVPGRSAPGWR
ncbi:MAG TPA: hypothetical protein VHO01_17050 [Jatrophihabitans sp.]|nr:hypothetical protein [Jatrophihabitans sp.]